MEPITIVVDVMYHSREYPFCQDITCGCHNDLELLADLGEALLDGRVREQDAGAVRYGEKPLPQKNVA